MNQKDILVSRSQKSNNYLNICLSTTGALLSVNDLFLQTFNVTNNWQNKSFTDFIQEKDVLFLNEAIAECNKEKGEVFTVLLEHLIEEKDFKVSWQLSTISTAGAELINARGVILSESEPTNTSNEDSPSTSALNSKYFTLLQNIFDYSVDIICALNEEGKFVTVSQVSKKIWGYEPSEIVGRHFTEFVYPEDLERTLSVREESRTGVELNNFENRFVRKDGALITMLWTAKWSENDKMMYCVARDGTKTKEYENAIKASEEKYKLIFYKNPQPMWIYDQDTYRFIEVNDAASNCYGYTKEEFLGMSIKDIRTPEELEKLLAHGGKLDRFSYKAHWRHKRKDGQIMDVEITAFSFRYDGKKAKLVLSNNITNHLVAEKELLKSNERYIYASKASFDAIWDWDMRTDEFYWSDSYEKLFGYKLENFREPQKRWLEKIHPDERQMVEEKLSQAIKGNAEHWEADFKYEKADRSYAYVNNRGIIIRNKYGTSYRMIGVMHDYTEKQKNEQSLKELNASLEKRASELASSNQELERFAYVASHDLQEPLRMVSSFLQLLQKRYKSQLDAKANEYIHFAVDGAERMKVLILDLLRYSRVNTMKEEHELVDLTDLSNNILFTFSQQLKETKASVNIAPLPTILGTRTQLIQLFQNLIGNALKYKSNEPPAIEVGFTDEQEHWQFYVKDNGIGIDPRFSEKIFVIFQRLHHKDEYSGTGIGLAICKKIVERHGGRIWVEPAPERGSVFYFTIKKKLQNNKE